MSLIGHSEEIAVEISTKKSSVFCQVCLKRVLCVQLVSTRLWLDSDAIVFDILFFCWERLGDVFLIFPSLFGDDMVKIVT